MCAGAAENGAVKILLVFLVQLPDHIGNGAFCAGGCIPETQPPDAIVAACGNEGNVRFFQHGKVVDGISGADQGLSAETLSQLPGSQAFGGVGHLHFHQAGQGIQGDDGALAPFVGVFFQPRKKLALFRVGGDAENAASGAVPHAEKVC